MNILAHKRFSGQGIDLVNHLIKTRKVKLYLLRVVKPEGGFYYAKIQK